MWVFEEMVNGRKLSEIINTDHENVKYLPGITLPDNVVSTLLHTKVLAYLPTYLRTYNMYVWHFFGGATFVNMLFVTNNCLYTGICIRR